MLRRLQRDRCRLDLARDGPEEGCNFPCNRSDYHGVALPLRGQSSITGAQPALRLPSNLAHSLRQQLLPSLVCGSHTGRMSIGHAGATYSPHVVKHRMTFNQPATTAHLDELTDLRRDVCISFSRRHAPGHRRQLHQIDSCTTRQPVAPADAAVDIPPDAPTAPSSIRYTLLRATPRHLAI
jgi:hypothetical protein